MLRIAAPMIPAGRPLHVVQVDPNANTPPYDRALCAALAAAGCRVTLLTSRFLYEALPPPSGYRLDERFFRLAASRPARRLGLAQRPAARRLLKAAEYPADWLLALMAMARTRPDIVHVQWCAQPSFDLLVWRALRQLGVPLVYTVHNLLPHDPQPGDDARYGRLYRAADALVVHSERSAAALHDRWGIPPENIVVTPMGPMLEGWVAPTRDEARRQLGLPADAALVLFAGLIEPYKGLADLIAAFSDVVRQRPAARLVVAGKPNQGFEGYARQLADLGIADRAVLDLQFLPEPRLAAYLCAADVVVLPYRSVTSSAMLLAARRFGCPLVATRVGDLAELIVDGQSGLLVPPNDPPSLGAAVERLLADPALAHRLGAAGAEATAGPERWTEAASRTLALYRTLRPC
jgi:glycosyltransferase involved in cell wall biosynthesis